MYRGSHLYTVFAVSLIVFFAAACGKVPPQVVATIGDRDSITMNQFSILLDKKYGIRTSDLSVSEKRKYLDLMITDRLKMLYGLEKGYEKEIALDEEKGKESIVMAKLNEQYILSAFLKEPDVEEYRRHLGITIFSQNLGVRFQDRHMSTASVSKVEAKKKADSVFAVINANNYNAVAEKMSDFKNPSTQKGNIRIEKFTVGQLPYTYEKVVFKMKPNEISGPVEVPGAFVIIHLISKDSSTYVKLDKDEVTKFMMSKLDDIDRFLTGPLKISFTDSLYRNGDVNLENQNILFLSNRLKDTVDVRASVNMFTSEERNLVLARFRGGVVTIQSFLENYSPRVTVKFNTDLLTQAVTIFCKSLLSRKLIVDDGFLNTEEYRYRALSIKEALIVGRVDESIVSTYTRIPEKELRKYYDDNRHLYRTNGSIVVSEIFTPHLSEIQKIQKALLSGVAFDKLVAEVKADAKFSPSLTFNFLKRDEVVSQAIRMKKGEVSHVIIRKDGGFSIIRLVNKSEPQLMDFAASRKKVENDHKRFLLKNNEMKLLLDIKKKWQVVVYENNLK